MIRRIWLQLSILTSSVLVGACTRTSNSGCLATGITNVETAKTTELIQGGYIHFGERVCTATFEVLEIGATEISLRGYSARHCRFESSSGNNKTSVSLYFDKTKRRSSGYLNNISVVEDFSQRASSALNAASQLSNIPKVKELFAEALQIPIHLDPWSEESFSGVNSIVCNNRNVAPDLNSPIKDLSQSCWSTLDLGIFDIKIESSSVSADDYSFLVEQLRSKQTYLRAALASQSGLTAEHQSLRKQIAASVGLLRLRQASPLAYLLNFDLCKVMPTTAVNTAQLCSNQRTLIEIAGRTFVEIDETGQKINIFDKLAQIGKGENSGMPGLSYAKLLSGERLPLSNDSVNFDSVLEIATALSADLHNLYKDRTAVTAINVRSSLKHLSGSAQEDKISPALVLGTNILTVQPNGTRVLRYVQLPLSSISSQQSHVYLNSSSNNPILNTSFGINGYGIFRLGLQRSSEIVKFQPTDSGSVLSLAGLIPILALNTVNDRPTSGGASILALPEASSEQIASGASKTSSNSENSFSQAGAKTVPISPQDGCY